MNRNIIILALLSVIVVLVIKPYVFEKQSINNITNSLDTTHTRGYNNLPDILSTIHNRKSVRHYIDSSIADKEIETLLRAGMAAPTAGNAQPWQFIIVKKRETLNKLGEFKWRTMLKNADAAIVVCGKPSNFWETKPENELFWTLDCSAASQNILLVAEAIGLGAVWCSVYPGASRIINVREILDIPDDVIPFSIISLGYPTGEDSPKNKWKPEKIHIGKW